MERRLKFGVFLNVGGRLRRAIPTLSTGPMGARRVPPTFFSAPFQDRHPLKLTLHAVAEDNTKRNANFGSYCLGFPQGSVYLIQQVIYECPIFSHKLQLVDISASGNCAP